MKVKDENIDGLIAAIFNIGQAMKTEFENCGKLFGGFNEKELLVIRFVNQNQNVKMSDIADNIEAPMSTLTFIVDKLIEKEYLTRDRSGKDRRVINVSSTSSGKAVYKTLMTRKKLIAQKILSKFNEKDQKNFIMNMNVLADSINI